MVSFEQDSDVKMNKKHISFSATLIAGVLLALSPKEHVVAEEMKDNNYEYEIKNLHTKYHSLLNQNEQENENIAQRTNNSDEVKAIQEQLLNLIEEEGNIELAEKLKKEAITDNELDELFNSLLEYPLSRAEESEEEVEEELDEPEEVLEEELEESEEIIEDEGSKEIEEVVENEESVEIEEVIKDEDPSKVEQKEVNAIESSTYSEVFSTKKSASYTGRSNDDLGNLDKPHSKQEFIEILGKHAEIAAKEKNLYASVMIAQAALETGFGTSGLSSLPNHNLYGMKGYYDGNSVVMRTREYSKSKGWYYVNAHFKKYPSYLESLLDHAAYIRRGPSWDSNFYYGVWYENTENYRDATAWLQGTYATDPSYASKLNQIIKKYNLTRFDMVKSNDTEPDKDVKPSTGDKTPDSTPGNAEKYTYKVKSGDTLSDIARSYKMSVRELKELNNLKSDLILVGQSLKVRGKAQPDCEYLLLGCFCMKSVFSFFYDSARVGV